MDIETIQRCLSSIYGLADVRRQIHSAYYQSRMVSIADAAGNRTIPASAMRLLTDTLEPLQRRERTLLETLVPQSGLFEYIVNQSKAKPPKPDPNAKDLKTLMTRLQATLTTYSDTKHPLTRKLLEEINAACDL